MGHILLNQIIYLSCGKAKFTEKRSGFGCEGLGRSLRLKTIAVKFHRWRECAKLACRGVIEQIKKRVEALEAHVGIRPAPWSVVQKVKGKKDGKRKSDA